jgi:predicted CXXCH cytochrome family protein
MNHFQVDIAGLAMNKETAKPRDQIATSQQPGANLFTPPLANNPPLPPFVKGGGLLLHAICAVFILISCGSAYAQGDLKEKVPGLCYRCHEKLKESLKRSEVHFPFKEGKCLSCHDSHASNMKKLVREEINPLCLGCHDGIKRTMANNIVHPALKRGVCTDCHNPHGAENRHLLVKAEKELCWDCHNPLKEQLKRTYIHAPFRNGECSSCHDPHASPQGNQIRADANKLCKGCHSAKCKVGGVLISSTTEKMDCITCHGGHASDSKGLLGPYGHSAFLQEKCDQCHNPIIADTKITMRIAGKDLCFSCHKRVSVKLRDSDVHLNDSKGACGMCHSYHASKKKNMTVKESQVCFSCHENTEKRTVLMEKALKTIRCVPVKDRKCFECHVPPHSTNPLYFKADSIQTCANCHTQQHKVAHPVGQNVKDPRNGQPLTCVTCHSMHSSKAEFMLYFDRKRQLCIQCHKK